MYKKFITKRGKKIGPYFYESVRLADGKVKAVYLGSDRKVALQRLQTLQKQNMHVNQTNAPLQSAPSEQLPSAPLSRRDLRLQELKQNIIDFEHDKAALLQEYRLLRQQYKKRVISPEFYAQKYALLFGQEQPVTRFIRYDSAISVCEQEILRLQKQQNAQPLSAPDNIPKENQKFPFALISFSLLTVALFFFLFPTHASLTGSAFLSLESSPPPVVTEHLDLVTNSSTTYILNITPETPITSLKVSGSYEEGGSVQIYLVNDNYLVYNSKHKEQTLLQKLEETLSSFLSQVTGNAILETTGTSFFVRDGLWQETPFIGSLSDNNLTLFLNSSSNFSLFFTDIEGNSFMAGNKATVLTPPDGFVFDPFFAFNLTDINFTNATLEKTADGSQLYVCSFWDFDLGLCLGSWEELLNLTPGENYSLDLPPGIIAYAEKSLPRIQEQTNDTNTSSLLSEISNISLTSLFFSQECASTCNIINFTGSEYKLIILIENTTLNLSTIEYTLDSENSSLFQKEAQQEIQEEESKQNLTAYTPTNTSGLRELLDNKEIKITYSGLDKPKQKNKIKQQKLILPKDVIIEDDFERMCQGHTCKQTIYQKPKYLVKEDGIIGLFANALEEDCEEQGDLCVKGKKYRAEFKQTPLEQESIRFSKDDKSIGFKPLQIRYADDNKEILISSANPIYGYGEGNIVYYKNIFGEGTEIRLTYQPDQLKEEVYFADKSIFTDNNIPSTGGYIFIDYLINLSEDLSFISENGIVTPPSDSIYFFNNTPIDSATDNIAVLPQPFAYSNSSFQYADYGLSATADGTILSVRIPVDIFSQTDYPIIVDPTIALNLTTILFDGFITFDSGTPCYERSSSGTFFYVGRSASYYPTCTFLDPPTTFSRGDIDWDISSIPRNADLLDANLSVTILQGSDETQLRLFQMDYNSTFYPDNSTGNPTFYTDMGNGTEYLTQTVSRLSFENLNLTNHTSFSTDFETILWNQIGWWSVGMTTEEGSVATKAFQIGSKEATSSADAPILTLEYTLPPPTITLNGLDNGVVVNSLSDILLNATITDNEPEIQEAVFYGSNKTTPDGDDIIYITQNFTQGTDVFTNWTAPVWESDANTVLLMHFNNRSLYGENDTEIFDYSPESNNGTIVSTAANQPVTKFNFTVENALGGSIEFNAVDAGEAENISLGDQDELIGSDYTWMFWLLPRTNTSNYGIFLNKLTGTTGFAVGQTSDGLFVNVGNGGSFTSINLTGFIDSLDRMQIAITLDSSNTLKVYKNGALYNTTDGVFIVGNDVPFEIGLQTFLTINTKIALDELVILNRTLTATEVANAYQLPYGDYYWFVNATDYSGEPIGVNMSEIRYFTYTTIPYAILSTPLNGSYVRPSSAQDIILNATAYSYGGNTMTVKIFGDNTSSPSGESLLYQENSVVNGTQIQYNWTSQTLLNYSGVSVLLHMDNRSEFGENDTEIYDFTGLGNNASCSTSGACPVFNQTGGKFGGGYEFPGLTLTGAFFNIPYQQAFTQFPFSVETWTKFNTLSTENGNNGTSVQIIAVQRHATSPFDSWTLSMRNNDDIILSMSNSSNSSFFSLSYTPPIEKDMWYHFVGVAESNGTVSLYVNGQKVANTLQMADLFNATSTLGFGGSPFSQSLNGTLDEFAMYTYALSSTEVANHYSLGRQKYYWYANVSDGTYENQSDTFEFSINSQPSVSVGPSLTPTNANTTDTFSCTFTITDDDSDDSLSYSGNFNNVSGGGGVQSFSGSATNGTQIQQTASGDIQGKNDLFTCDVTASDIKEASTQATSNTVQVLNSPSLAPSLTGPTDLNATFNRTPSFDFDAVVDPDGDDINYTLNLTCLSTAGGSCSGAGDDRLLNFTTNATGFSEELKFFIDDTYFYNWTVLAFDGENESAWAIPERRVNISVLVDFSISTSSDTDKSTDFGNMILGETKEALCYPNVVCTPGVPLPLFINNTGNAEININLTENSTSSLFSTNQAPSTYYQIKASQRYTTQVAPFDWANSIINYTSITRATPLFLIAALNHSAFNIDNLLEADINVTVPSDETPGYKESTLEFIASYTG